MTALGLHLHGTPRAATGRKRRTEMNMAARDPKNLDKVKVGDNVEITYTEALAISLDKPANK